MAMEPPPKPSQATLFQVYLRLRPPIVGQRTIPSSQPTYPQLPTPGRFINVEPESPISETFNPDADGRPTHITLNPPNDSRKRAVEKFAFTKVFEEHTSQLDVFHDTRAVELVEGVLDEGRDGLLATLGVTGSGKSHTILGSKQQRGLTQLSLDLLFKSLDNKTLHPNETPSLIPSLIAQDASEAQITAASSFLEGVYGESAMPYSSRAATPMTVCDKKFPSTTSANDASVRKKKRQGLWEQWDVLGLRADSESRDSTATQEGTVKGLSAAKSDKQNVKVGPNEIEQNLPSKLPFWGSPRITRTKAKLRFGTVLQDTSFMPPPPVPPKRHAPPHPSTLPTLPDVSHMTVSSSNMDYTILVSMYEVYNDRIFDLLTNPRGVKDAKRRALLFKSTEGSPDRKVVAGLRKVVCGTYEEALMVLETGLLERRVAGTGSNSVSSRSHGFFCVEVKKKFKSRSSSSWNGAQLTIVDLAGSERARNAKTAGATLAEAGNINQSLMYLGQCLQMQSDQGDNSKSSIVPFRQCKLTELLFSNSFPSSSSQPTTHTHRNPQKAVMIVTADPVGDFNATSQILRYSALAREVTVPRIPSVTDIVFHGVPNPHSKSRGTTTASGRTSPDQLTSTLSFELDEAAREVGRLSDEVEILTLKLAEETVRRREAEEGWKKSEERLETLELEVREECADNMERLLDVERRRWMNALGEEKERGDEHVDRKLEVLTRGITIHEDADADTGVFATAGAYVADLEADNETLRKKIESLERELLGRSPTKRPTRANAKDNGRTTLQLADPFGVDDLISAQKENREGIETLSKLELLRLGGAV